MLENDDSPLDISPDTLKTWLPADSPSKVRAINTEKCKDYSKVAAWLYLRNEKVEYVISCKYQGGMSDEEKEAKGLMFRVAMSDRQKEVFDLISKVIIALRNTLPVGLAARREEKQARKAEAKRPIALPLSVEELQDCFKADGLDALTCDVGHLPRERVKASYKELKFVFQARLEEMMAHDFGFDEDITEEDVKDVEL